ncbi:Alg9-like mannosyltransferase family protein [Neolewinella xylanilytica]|uniref:Alg9-like mannosyltransferase family protein n=2 Tax=Neolewinella xylanilytica TaxID=1514080 RepID=A0A2S6I6C3_9BACT|nr:Alg9-like mannosyltransferase family protein [Neolewinella xylanilytica]
MLAAFLFLLTAYFSVGHHQGDEHFQILEFAAYKLGLAASDDLSWEYHEAMRPALQPAMVFGLYRVLEVFGPVNPFVVAFLLRLLSAGATLGLVAVLHLRYRDQLLSGERTGWLLLLLFNWCLYYNGVRFSSENWGGLAAIAGLLSFPIRWNDRHSFTPTGGYGAVFAGVFFGLAFLFRYQLALFVGGFYVWWLLFYRKEWGQLLTSVAGGLAVLAICYPLTYWLYGEWTIPAWNYFTANLVAGKAAGYGTLPWWAYLKLVFLRGVPPLGLLYVAATLYFVYRYRKDPVAWSVGAFVLVHSLLGRKDIRFLFPLIPVLPVLIAGSWRGLADFLLSSRLKRGLRPLVWTCIVVNGLLLAAVVFRPAASEIAPLHFLYRHYPGPATLTGAEARIIVAEETTGRFFHRRGHRLDPGLTDYGTCAPAPCLYLRRTNGDPRPPDGAKLVYTDRPDWLLSWLPFGLLSREKWWYIYEV